MMVCSGADGGLFVRDLRALEGISPLSRRSHSQLSYVGPDATQEV